MRNECFWSTQAARHSFVLPSSTEMFSFDPIIIVLTFAQTYRSDASHRIRQVLHAFLPGSLASKRNISKIKEFHLQIVFFR